MPADPETGEILEADQRLLKWQMQAVARVALGVFDPGQAYQDGHRIRVCHRHQRPDLDGRGIEVRQSETSGRAYYSGVMACGSVWVCPVCAAKVQAVRALEVRSAIDAATARGWQTIMLTQTIRHSRADALSDLLEGFTGALRKFKGQRAYTRLSGALGVRGSIRGLEVTHGANGWHVHAHTVLFLDRPAQLGKIEAQLFPLWEAAVARAGLGTIDRRAFDVQDASAVRSYVTKMGQEYRWNAEHELVRSHSKRGRSSYSPFDLLRANLDESRPDLLGLFREYGEAFHGRRQLVWSRGLKAELEVGPDRSDEAIAQSVGHLDRALAGVPLTAWREIRRRNLQGQVLRIAEDHGADGLGHALDALEGTDDEGRRNQVVEDDAREDGSRTAVGTGPGPRTPVDLRSGGLRPGAVARGPDRCADLLAVRPTAELGVCDAPMDRRRRDGSA